MEIVEGKREEEEKVQDRFCCLCLVSVLEVVDDSVLDRQEDALPAPPLRRLNGREELALPSRC